MNMLQTTVIKVYHSISQIVGNKSSLKGVTRPQPKVANFEILHTLKYLWIELESSNCVCLQAISSVSLRTTDHAWKGRGPGHVTILEFYTPLNLSGMA